MKYGCSFSEIAYTAQPFVSIDKYFRYIQRKYLKYQTIIADFIMEFPFGNESYYNHENATDHFTVFFKTYGTVTITAIGTVANILILIVILASQLRKSVFMNIILFLAIADILRLWSVASIRRGLFGIFGLGQSLTLCRIFIFVLYMSSTMSSWMVVLVSIERFVAVYYPLRVHTYCTLKRIYIVILVMVIASCVTSIPYFFSCSVSVTNKGIPACKSIGSNDILNLFNSITSFFLYVVIPFFTITTFNILIVLRIRRQRNFRARSTSQQEEAANNNKHKGLISMMIAVCIVFAVASFPKMILMLIVYSCRLGEGEQCISFFMWPFTFAMFLDDLNHCINLFLYCLSGSVFRNALLKVFRFKT